MESPMVAELDQRPTGDEPGHAAAERVSWVTALTWLLPALTSGIALLNYPFRFLGELISETAEHAVALSGLFAVVVPVTLLLRRGTNQARRTTALLAVFAGTSLGVLACFLYFPVGSTLAVSLILGILVTGAYAAERASVHLLPGLDIPRLRWVMVSIPPVYILAISAIMAVLHYEGLMGHGLEHLVLASSLLAGSLPFALFVFRVFQYIHARILDQQDKLMRLNLDANQRAGQMRALNNAGFDLTSDLSLEHRARRLVDLGRELSGASDGSLIVLDEAGRPQWALASGTSCPNMTGRLLAWAEARKRNCDCGLCDALLSENPAANHSPSRFLAPLQWRSGRLGYLTLVQSDGAEFTAADRQLLGMYAQWGTLAIKNAQLFQQVRALAVVEERDRIAREMHDNFGQMLGYVNTKVQAIGTFLKSGGTSEALDQLDQLQRSTQELYEDVREAIVGLRGTRLLDQGLVGAIQLFAGQFEDSNGIETRVELGQSLDFALSPEGELQAFRIVQEALTNALKHAAATRVSISVSSGDSWLDIRIRDDGRGFDLGSANLKRFGLKTMEERAQLLGGSLTINTAPGRGTEVLLRAPAGPAGMTA